MPAIANHDDQAACGEGGRQPRPLAVMELHLEPAARGLGVGYLGEAALAVADHVEGRHHADEQACVGVQWHRGCRLRRRGRGCHQPLCAAATAVTAAAHRRRRWLGGGRPAGAAVRVEVLELRAWVVKGGGIGDLGGGDLEHPRQWLGDLHRWPGLSLWRRLTAQQSR